jgi:hypothetical protein
MKYRWNDDHYFPDFIKKIVGQQPGHVPGHAGRYNRHWIRYFVIFGVSGLHRSAIKLVNFAINKLLSTVLPIPHFFAGTAMIPFTVLTSLSLVKGYSLLYWNRYMIPTPIYIYRSSTLKIKIHTCLSMLHPYLIFLKKIID